MCSAPSATYALSLHDALPIFTARACACFIPALGNVGLRATPALASPAYRCGGRRIPTAHRQAHSLPTATRRRIPPRRRPWRSEEHTSELQSHVNIVCRLLLDRCVRPPQRPTLFPYTTLFRSLPHERVRVLFLRSGMLGCAPHPLWRRRHIDVADAEFRQRIDKRIHYRRQRAGASRLAAGLGDRKSTRLNSSHMSTSYAVFFLIDVFGPLSDLRSFPTRRSSDLYRTSVCVFYSCARECWVARHTRSGVAGISMWRTPNSDSASTSAFITDGNAPAHPASPQPLEIGRAHV